MRFSSGAGLLLHTADRVILDVWRESGDDNVPEGPSGEMAGGAVAEHPSPPRELGQRGGDTTKVHRCVPLTWHPSGHGEHLRQTLYK